MVMSSVPHERPGVTLWPGPASPNTRRMIDSDTTRQTGGARHQVSRNMWHSASGVHALKSRTLAPGGLIGSRVTCAPLLWECHDETRDSKRENAPRISVCDGTAACLRLGLRAGDAAQALDDFEFAHHYAR
ncbi:uncharacterized protein PV07_01012 [Cladophialophora immunda]|uniref:Uncharacterized protein n=1 Tax=Cladophialophora immunda TaxID=569365 RepID=A0A0D2CWF7_9EURO|nr:uncharacterized protein PV07_01012 [Cladophialophora immunda]KIW34220.1 hypothetical protein PV07_01012 [Cladophialophora immunda]